MKIYKISFISLVLVLSGCGMEKWTPKDISAVKINTNISPSEINSSNKITVKNLKGESRTYTSSSFDYDAFDEYNFTQNQFSKKRRTLIVSHPNYNPDTIIIKRKLRPGLFTLDLLGAMSIYLSPSMIIDFANGNIWKVKKSSKVLNLTLNRNKLFYENWLKEITLGKKSLSETRNFFNSNKNSEFVNNSIGVLHKIEFDSIKANPSFDKIDFFRKTYSKSIFNDSLILVEKNLQLRDEKLKLLTEDKINKKIEFINMLISSTLNYIKELSKDSSLISLADALLFDKLFDNKENPYNYSFLNAAYKPSASENKYIDEFETQQGDRNRSLRNFHRVNDRISKINSELENIQELCNKMTDQTNFVDYLKKINDTKFTTLLCINALIKNSGYKEFRVNDYYSRSIPLSNFLPSITRKQFQQILKKDPVFYDYIIDEINKQSLIEFFNQTKNSINSIIQNEKSTSKDGKRQRNVFSFNDEDILYKTFVNYNFLKNNIIHSEFQSVIPSENSSNSYFNYHQEFNFHRNRINWEEIIKNDRKLSRNDNFKNNYKMIDINSKEFPEITTTTGISKYNMGSWNGNVFYIYNEKPGFYKSISCGNVPDERQYCGMKALIPLQLLDVDSYEINLFKPNVIFKNDTVILTLTLKNNSDKIDYYRKYFKIKSIRENPSFIYPSGEKNEAASQSQKDILNAQSNGQINSVETQLLLNKIDYGNYNPGTPELAPIFLDVEFIGKDYNLDKNEQNWILVEFDRLDPFDPKNNLLVNYSEFESEKNQFQLIFDKKIEDEFENNLKKVYENKIGIIKN